MASSEQPCLLLEVNALMALAWPNHQHHRAVVARHFDHLLGHQQVTDAYLLALAAAHDAVLLTLDRRLAPPAGGGADIEVVTPRGPSTPAG